MKWDDFYFDEPVIVTGGRNKGRIGYIDDEEYPYLYVHFDAISFGYDCTRIHHKYLEHISHMDLIARLEQIPSLMAKLRRDENTDYHKLISLYEEYIYVSSLQTEYHFNSLYKKPTKDIHVFISCSKQESAFANNLAADLRMDGYSVFVYTTSIKVGENIIQKISNHVNSSDFLIPVFSQHYIKSQFCMDEVTAFYMNHIKNKPNSMLPIVYDGVEVPPLFSMYKYIDYKDYGYNACLSEIRSALIL